MLPGSPKKENLNGLCCKLDSEILFVYIYIISSVSNAFNYKAMLAA